MIALNTRYTLILPAGSISDTGIRLISDFMQNESLQSDEWKALNPNNQYKRLPELPETWEWTWVVQRGEYAGTFPKRVSNYYFKVHNLRTPQSFLQQLGNLARAHSSENVSYAFEFVDTFDWHAGEFGDAVSCYWGANSGAREMLKANGAWAIRFYNDSGKGYARAWVVRLEDALYVLFNGYGFKSNSTLTATRVMASFLGLSYAKITLRNYGSPNGVLYINSGVGYVIGRAEEIESIDRHDFEWDEIHEYSCYNCGDGLTETEIYTGADDESYCADCFYERFETCYHCGETYWLEDLTYVADYYYCEYCLDRLFVCCDNCGEYVLPEHITVTNDGAYCQNCIPDESEE